MRKHMLLWVLLLSLITSPAYAYLDGGTGSVIIQGFLAGIAGFLAMIKLYWHKIKTLFKRLPRANKPSLPEMPANHKKT